MNDYDDNDNLKNNDKSSFSMKMITDKHIVLFLIVVSIVQILAMLSQNNVYHANIFQMATMTGLFACIQGTDTVFEYLVGGLLASCISYASFVLFEKGNQNVVVITLIRFVNNIIIAGTLLYFNCFNVPALSYGLAAPTLIPQMGMGYLGSYCIGCMISILLVLGLSPFSPNKVELKWM